jgi:hypothetical protein
MSARFTLLSAALLLVLCSSIAGAQTVTAPQQFAWQPLDAAAGASEETARQALAATKSVAPGAVLFKKDRGPHTGSFALFWPAGSTGPGRAATVYQVVGNVGTPPALDLLGIHYIKVRPDRAADFEKFVSSRLNPAVANLRPDLRLLYYKATGGPDAGSYVTVFGVTKASRDKYWPKGQDSDDLKAAFTPAVKALAADLQTYLVDGTWGTGMTAQVYEAKDWADWVIVEGAR